MSVDQVDDLLTVHEAAAILKVSTVTIKRYLKQGRLRAYHVGPRAIRIRVQDLKQVMQPTAATEASMPQVAQEKGRSAFPKPTPEELRRRQAVAKEILALRRKTDIRPLTTADLVRQARDERTWYGTDR